MLGHKKNQSINILINPQTILSLKLLSQGINLKVHKNLFTYNTFPSKRKNYLIYSLKEFNIKTFIHSEYRCVLPRRCGLDHKSNEHTWRYLSLFYFFNHSWRFHDSNQNKQTNKKKKKIHMNNYYPVAKNLLIALIIIHAIKNKFFFEFTFKINKFMGYILLTIYISHWVWLGLSNP